MSGYGDYSMNKNQLFKYKDEAEHHLVNELLPFWRDRCKDNENGGFVTHFDKNGNDTGEDEKSLIAQARCIYTMASAHRAGYGDGIYAEYAKHGVDFLIEKMWDNEFGGFYWMMDRAGRVKIDKKILYGHSFAIYALSEYTLATGDPVGREYAEKIFDLIRKYCLDSMYGGFFEMFRRNWNLAGPGSDGGDRKTLDVHMHLMEAFTTLYECTQLPVHRRALQESIQIVTERMLHPEYGTGIPQFMPDWQVAPQIKFDIVWGWDRFPDGGQQSKAEDNTSYGHNVEFAWLFKHALDILEEKYDPNMNILKKLIDHAADNGIDDQFGGVYVEGPHRGGVYDREKEFWQQAEALIGMLDACLLFGPEKYFPVYENVHRFVFDKVIDHKVGEWLPLLKREGEPIWTHLGHSWKINYHTVRSMIQTINRLGKLIDEL